MVATITGWFWPMNLATAWVGKPTLVIPDLHPKDESR
jgi:hypothetical protein